MKKRKNICLVYTGGTIGMVGAINENGERVLRPPHDPNEFLSFLKIEEEIQDIVDMHFHVLFNKDSTNVVPSDWTKIAQFIYEKREEFDGFVVSHGTDTMHFSSSAVSFAFGKELNFPIVFTGAQTTPDVSHGDARINILRAIKVACEDIAEVVLSFGDYVFRGSRVQKKDEKRFDAFESPAEFPVGYITEDIVIGNTIKKIDTTRGKDIKNFQPYFDNGIIQFSLIPGLKPKLLFPILESDDCKGVVLQSFGSGNVPNIDEYSFQDFIKKATELNKPVIITSQFPANSTLDSHYEPGIDAIKAGAITTGNMTNAAATVKFRWILHIINQEIKNSKLSEKDKIQKIAKLMNTSHINEVTINIKGE